MIETYYWHDGVVYAASGRALDYCTWRTAEKIAADTTWGPAATLVRGLPPGR